MAAQRVKVFELLFISCDAHNGTEKKRVQVWTPLRRSCVYFRMCDFDLKTTMYSCGVKS